MLSRTLSSTGGPWGALHSDRRLERGYYPKLLEGRNAQPRAYGACIGACYGAVYGAIQTPLRIGPAILC
jgi:hypothetical protein